MKALEKRYTGFHWSLSAKCPYKKGIRVHVTYCTSL